MTKIVIYFSEKFVLHIANNLTMVLGVAY